jgi:hypothetical protein
MRNQKVSASSLSTSCGLAGSKTQMKHAVLWGFRDLTPGSVTLQNFLERPCSVTLLRTYALHPGNCV